jgi:hypothetical protein
VFDQIQMGQASELHDSVANMVQHLPLADVNLDLYSLTQQMDSLVQNQLTGWILALKVIKIIKL